MSDLRYLLDPAKFLAYAFDVFVTHIPNKEEFFAQFTAILGDEEKNAFLRIASVYRFFVKCGKYTYSEPGFAHYVDYIDETYKYVALMSLIEAMYAGERYLTFYEWLSRRPRADKFPINDLDALQVLYKQYNLEYGATQSAVRFFSSLSEPAQKYLQTKLNIDGKTESVEFLAKLLYGIRSEFMHQARLALEFGEGAMFSTRNGKRIQSTMTLGDLELLFESGMLKRFGFCPSNDVFG